MQKSLAIRELILTVFNRNKNNTKYKQKPKMSVGYSEILFQTVNIYNYAAYKKVDNRDTSKCICIDGSAY